MWLIGLKTSLADVSAGVPYSTYTNFKFNKLSQGASDNQNWAHLCVQQQHDAAGSLAQ